jgi:quinol monooxygenase YgiN
MTIGVIARLTVQAGKNADFEAIFKRLADAVNSREPGCHFYALHRSRIDAQQYVVLEQYADQAALDAHGGTDYFGSIGAELAGCLAAPPKIEYLDAV